jgi:ribosome biogenesis GTPase A
VKKNYLKKENIIMSKCIGCGAKLQSTDQDIIGYTRNLKSNLCERCFRIKNYGDYKFVVKNNDDFVNILDEINDELVLLVVDLFNISESFKMLNEHLKKAKVLLVLTKKDIMPEAYEERLLDYLDLDVVDKVIISSSKNYNFDELYDKIIEHQTSKDVYVVGFTNAGKSTMINRLFADYSSNDAKITTSYLPSTTLNSIKIEFDEYLTLIDTPGLIEEGNMLDYIDAKTLKMIQPKKRIKPITYQVREKQYFYIKDLLQLEVADNNVIFYMSNQLEIKRLRHLRETDLVKHVIDIRGNEDLVIKGLGFIKFMKDETITIYTIKDVKVYKRIALI